MVRRRVARAIGVPDTLEGWLMRVLTVAVVLTLAIQVVLFRELAALQTYVEQARHSREDFQDDQREFMRLQQARVCALVRDQVRYGDQGDLGC